MKIIQKDIFDSDVSIIIHQCNCFWNMEDGFAKQLKEKFPEAQIADRKTKFGDRNKLGSYSKVCFPSKNLKYIFNLYSQYRYGTNEQQTDYDALQYGLNDIFYWCLLNNFKRVGMPYLIGCESGEGNQSVVLQILKKLEMQNKGIQIQLYKKEKK